MKTHTVINVEETNRRSGRASGLYIDFLSKGNYRRNAFCRITLDLSDLNISIYGQKTNTIELDFSIYAIEIVDDTYTKYTAKLFQSTRYKILEHNNNFSIRSFLKRKVIIISDKDEISKIRRAACML